MHLVSRCHPPLNMETEQQELCLVPIMAMMNLDKIQSHLPMVGIPVRNLCDARQRLLNLSLILLQRTKEKPTFDIIRKRGLSRCEL